MKCQKAISILIDTCRAAISWILSSAIFLFKTNKGFKKNSFVPNKVINFIANDITSLTCLS